MPPRKVAYEDALSCPRPSSCIRKYKTLLTLIVGLHLASDAVEVMLLGLLGRLLEEDMELDKSQVNLLQGTIFIGELVGSLLLGPLSDRYGRRPVSLFTSLLILVFGMATAFVSHIGFIILFRAIVGVGIGGLTAPFDLLSEFSSPEHRARDMLGQQYFWTVGGIMPALFVLATYGWWRGLVFLSCIPSMLAGVLMATYGCESPAWLILKNRQKEAKDVLRWIWRFEGYKGGWEGTPLDSDTVISRADVREEDEGGDEEEHEHLNPGGPSSSRWFATTRKIFSTRRHLRVIRPLFVLWFGFGFGYYGLVFLTAKLFSSLECYEASFDIRGLTMSTLSEFGGTTLVYFTVDHTGRRLSQLFCYGLAGLLLFTMTQLNAPSRWTLTFFSMGARMFEMAASSVTWLTTPELLTVDVRGTGHAYCNAMARIGAFICPFVVNGGLKPAGFTMLVVHVALVGAAVTLPESFIKARQDHSATFKQMEMKERYTRVTNRDTDDGDSNANTNANTDTNTNMFEI